MSLWQIVALAVVGLLLVSGAVVLLVLQRRRAPRPKAPPPLSAAWRRFLGSLPERSRGDPVVVVLGARLSGKSRLIEAGMELGASPATSAQGGPDDPRLTLYTGRGVLMQEISGDLLEDTRPEARGALRDLWAPIALDVPLVLAVIDTHAASWTPAGLQRLGSLIRDKVDLLTALRGSAPRVRVCLTHLDESAEGFAELATVARDAGHVAGLEPVGKSGGELAASLAPLDAYVPAAVGKLEPAAFGRVTRFSTRTGRRVVSALAPFLDALLAARTGLDAPAFDVVLSAQPEDAEQSGGSADHGRSADDRALTSRGATAGAATKAILGDPLAVDAGAVARDARALDRRRTLAAAFSLAALAALLFSAYGYHRYTIARADQAVRKFSSAVQRAQREPQKGWSSDADARAAEAEAGDALAAALTPLYPPLRLAYPARKHGLAAELLQRIRELYLFPVIQGADRTKRIYALALLYASSDDALGEQVKSAPGAWATELDVPVRVVNDYLAWSEQPWTGAVEPPAHVGGDVTLDDWRAWIAALEDALRREKITPDELSRLQAQARRLSDSAGGALQVRGLERIIKLLQEARGAEIDAFLGGGDLQRAPRWVSESWDALDALLSMVQRASLATPAWQGKSLRRALDDVSAIARDGAGETAKAYTLRIDGETREIHSDAWSALLRSSRASLYVDGFLDDLRGGRSPFFVRPSDWAAVGGATGRSRGPYKSLPGIDTARAVAAEVKPALDALDPTCDAARLPADDRAALTRTASAELTRYAAAYRAALWDYITSFRLDATSAAGLRTDLEDMVGPSSWFTDYLVTVAENAAFVDEGNGYLKPLVEALAPFQAIVALMAGDKGKYPALDQYYAIIAAIVPSLDASAPLPPGPAGAALADRLTPLGKLGLALLDTGKPAPLPQTGAWLDGARIFDKALREPFLVPVEIAYALSLQEVEKTLTIAYRDQIRPLVAPLLSRFPLDPRGSVDVSPDDLLAVVGPAGSFRTALDQLIAPVCKNANTAACAPKAPVGFRAVQIPGDAAELAGWSASLGAALWDESSKPKPIALTARARPLQEVKRGAATAVTRSFLRSGGTTVYGFNQAPTWQALPVPWSTSATAGVGMELTAVGGEPVPQSLEAEGAAWRLYHLLCRAETTPGSTFTWPFDPQVSFDILPDPWAVVVPPANRGRRCAQMVARK